MKNLMRATALLICFSLSAHANLIIVNSNQDVIAADNNCTLREALSAANFDVAIDQCAAGSGDDLIWLLLSATNDSIQLNNQLPIIDGVEIQGPGADNLVLIPANGHNGHMFQINTDRDVSLKDFRIGGANASAIDVVNVDGLEIANMRFLNNSAGGNGTYGGAIHADAQDGDTQSINSLLIENTLFQSNSAEFGGAVAAGGTHEFVVSSSVFTNNSASATGAAIYRYYRGFDPIEDNILTINNSQFIGNATPNGTVASLQQTLDINESLFQNNTGSATINALNARGAIRNSIFTDRVSGNALFITGIPAAPASIVSIEYNTFLNQSSATDVLVGNVAVASMTGNAFAGSNTTSCLEVNEFTLESNGYNLETFGSSCTSQATDMPNTDAMLMPLGLYGGNISIAPPHPLSPLVDAGDMCSNNDISGEGRPRDGDASGGLGQCDIGAVERPSAYGISLSFTGTGSGEVSLPAFDLTCQSPDSCLWPLPQNETYAFTPDADSGSTFIAWGSSCSGDMGCAVTMDGFKFLTAEFASLSTPVTLTVNKFFDTAGLTATVTSAPAGLNCGPTCSADFMENDLVILSASVGEGAAIDTWSGCDSIQNDDCHITLGSTHASVSLFVMQDPDIIFKNGFQ